MPLSVCFYVLRRAIILLIIGIQNAEVHWNCWSGCNCGCIEMGDSFLRFPSPNRDHRPRHIDNCDHSTAAAFCAICPDEDDSNVVVYIGVQ